ncbi:MAG: hypothetical protein JWP64_2520, partial [Pseudonocardia sp.]|nr:hypothetical protein [Pseudonocardia sp.]
GRPSRPAGAARRPRPRVARGDRGRCGRRRADHATFTWPGTARTHGAPGSPGFATRHSHDRLHHDGGDHDPAARRCPTSYRRAAGGPAGRVGGAPYHSRASRAGSHQGSRRSSPHRHGPSRRPAPSSRARSLARPAAGSRRGKPCRPAPPCRACSPGRPPAPCQAATPGRRGTPSRPAPPRRARPLRRPAPGSRPARLSRCRPHSRPVRRLRTGSPFGSDRHCRLPAGRPGPRRPERRSRAAAAARTRRPARRAKRRCGGTGPRPFLGKERVLA